MIRSAGMDETTPESPRARPSLGFRPLYRQVSELIVDRLVKGVWKPGELLPSEVKLAADLGVSQGTVRRALDDLGQRHLLVRRQGRGTYVADLDRQRSLFRFFHFQADSGATHLPVSRLLKKTLTSPKRGEIDALNLGPQDQIVRLERVRFLDNQPVIYELVSVPASVFPELNAVDDVPNELYSMYSSNYGVTVVRATEELRAVTARKKEAQLLEIDENAPLLEIRRIAIALDERAIELRISRCNTRDHHYVTEVT